MRRDVTRFHGLTVGLSVALLLAGCGGSGGGGGGGGGGDGPGDGLRGTYHVVTFAGVSGDDRYSRAGWGAFIADPIVGVVDGTTDQNEYVPPAPTTDSEIIGPVPFGPAPFWVRGDEEVTIEEDSSFHGGSTEDGRVLGLASGGAGDPPAILLMLRREGSFTTASLSGDYHFFLFGHDQGMQAGAAYRGSASLDGTGDGSVDIEQLNIDGAISGPVSPVAATYSISTQGTVTYAFGLNTYEGGVLAGGDLAILAGSVDTTSPSRALIVLIRKSTAADNASFSGLYERVFIARREGTGWDAIGGVVSASGTGSWARNGGFNNGDGVIFPRPATAPFPYTVDPDGTWQSGDTRGALSPDGRIAVYMVMGIGTLPSLSFLVR